MANPASRPAPRVVASSTGEISTGRPMASASAVTKTSLSDMPPSTRSVVDGEPAVAFGGFDQVGAAVGHAFEDGPHQLGTARAPGQADQGAAGAEVPDRRAQAEERRDEPHVAGGLALGGDGGRLPGGGRGRRGRRAATRRRCRPRASPPRRPRSPARRPGRPRSGRCRARPARRGSDGASGPDALVQHAAGAEGGLGQPGPGAPWPDQ